VNFQHGSWPRRSTSQSPLESPWESCCVKLKPAVSSGIAINAPPIANNPPAKPTTAPRATKRITSEKFMATAGTSSQVDRRSQTLCRYHMGSTRASELFRAPALLRASRRGSACREAQSASSISSTPRCKILEQVPTANPRRIRNTKQSREIGVSRNSRRSSKGRCAGGSCDS